MEISQELSKNDIICHTRSWNRSIQRLHWHDRYELCQVLENNIRIIIEGKEVRASVGDIVAIDERVIHQFIIDEDCACARIFQIPVKLLLSFSSTVKPLKTHIKSEEIAKVLGLQDKLEALFEIFEQEKNGELVAKDSFFQSIAISIYCLLERHFPEVEKLTVNTRERKDFYDAVDYINKHFKEDITVESIAKALFLSRGRLATAFKMYTGEGTADYINKLRIKNANLLLSQGVSAAVAAMESGFNSIRTFNNVYKSYMSITPSEYIKKKK